MKQILALVALLLAGSPCLHAQQEPEYRLELGAGAGLVSYVGDLNGSLIRGLQPMGTFVAKYKPNPRMAWDLFIGFGQLKGSSKNADTWLPELTEHPIEFKRGLTDVAFRYECNFWPYGTGREYRGARQFTPFITIGLGLSFAGSAAGGQIPLGVGVKYKLATRWNMALEWTMHITGSDELDGTRDPYGIKSSGMFKNTDCYGVLGLTLTYDLWQKCPTCNNDKD